MRFKELLYELNPIRPNDSKRTKIIKEFVIGYNPYVFIEGGFKCVWQEHSF